MLIFQANTHKDVDAARTLFNEYAAGLGISLCFQNFDKELNNLPGDYAPHGGLLLLAKENGNRAGCVALRPLDATACEMKRLYVRPAFRGAGLGGRLAEAAVAHARAAGYRRICLDTLPTMQEARALYASLGFKPSAPYYDNACAGSDCFELKLDSVISHP